MPDVQDRLRKQRRRWQDTDVGRVQDRLGWLDRIRQHQRFHHRVGHPFNGRAAHDTVGDIVVELRISPRNAAS